MNNIDAGKYQPRLFLGIVKQGKVDDAVFERQMAVHNTLHFQAARCKISDYTSIRNMLTPAQK